MTVWPDDDARPGPSLPGAGLSAWLVAACHANRVGRFGEYINTA